MLRRHRLTVYATEDGIQTETFVHFKIVQTLVKHIRGELTCFALTRPASLYLKKVGA